MHRVNLTHCGLGLHRTGINNNVFQLSCLLFAAELTFDKLLTRRPTEYDTIVWGRVLDLTVIPCYAVLNRGRPTQVIVGPNRVFYDAACSKEFKILIPARLMQQYYSDQNHATLELFTTHSENCNIKIASKVLLESGGNQMRLSREDPQNADPALVP